MAHVLKPFYGKLCFVVALIFLEAVMVTFWLPEALEKTVNAIEWQGQEGYNLHRLLMLGGFFLLLQSLMTIIIRIEDYLLDIDIKPKLAKSVTKKSMAHVLNKKYNYFGKIHSGFLSENITRLSDAVSHFPEILISKVFFFVCYFSIGDLPLHYTQLILGITVWDILSVYYVIGYLFRW